MRSLLLMIQFMTRYPLPVNIEFTAENFIRGMKWMPVVGLVVGLPAGAIVTFGSPLLGKELSSFAAVCLLIGTTGGLHLDGLADSADGLFSYRSRERILEIMRDSTLGTNGVAALLLFVLGKFLLIKNLPDEIAGFVVVLCPILSRMALTWHSAAAVYARQEPGIGEFVNATSYRHASAATGVSFFLCLLLLALSHRFSVHFVILICLLHAIAIGIALFFAMYVRRRIGGITGDTIGATVELAEAGCLASCILLLKIIF